MGGVYLIIRLNFIFCRSNRTNLLLFMGIITILLAGAAAIFEMDMKKVIALSTLRQLGVIIMILGGMEPVLSFFHLLRHAYFKAILFICAGMIIHNIKDYQDIRKIRIISTIRFVIFLIIIVATFFTVAYSCRISFLLTTSYTAKDSIYMSDDNDYLIITGIIFLFPFSIAGGINIIWSIFSFPPVIFLPVWLKVFVLFLIFT